MTKVYLRKRKGCSRGLKSHVGWVGSVTSCNNLLNTWQQVSVGNNGDLVGRRGIRKGKEERMGGRKEKGLS